MRAAEPGSGTCRSELAVTVKPAPAGSPKVALATHAVPFAFSVDHVLMVWSVPVSPDRLLQFVRKSVSLGSDFQKKSSESLPPFTPGVIVS